MSHGGPDDETRDTDAPGRPLPTAALARLYEEQGLTQLAIATWRDVLAASPADVDAMAALQSLGAKLPDGATSPALGVSLESSGELPTGYGRDEVVALPVDATSLLVYWEITDAGIQRGRLAGGDGPIALRVVSTWLGDDGAPTQHTRDSILTATMGEAIVEGLQDGAAHVCAVGLVASQRASAFVPIAHAPPIATPRAR